MIRFFLNNSGSSSFIDFLIFFQNKEPVVKDNPIYAIEETKTDDSESRNTGVYQWCSKFVFLDYYCPNVKKIMLYSLQVQQKKKPTQTNIFGTRMLLTLGVEILGKKLDTNIFVPFTSIDELIKFKMCMRKPPKGNVPINITKKINTIEVSGRLFKKVGEFEGLSHDPNIGALSIIGAILRKLGWKKDIIITKHGLLQKHIRTKNKFVIIASRLKIKLDKLTIPITTIADYYWYYDKNGEKLGTLFIHLAVENFTKGYSIFENHAGCEKGYFIQSNGEPIALEKYADRDKYKAGDKTQIIHIPDLILLDPDNTEIINIEGKKYQFMQNGINELDNYDFIEKYYIKKNYPKFSIIRSVVLYGCKTTELIEIKVGFLLNEDGHIVLGVQAPKLFRKAIKNLKDFWN